MAVWPYYATVRVFIAVTFPSVHADVVTTTPCGKAVGTVVILSGVLAIALPIAVIVNAFGKVCSFVSSHSHQLHVAFRLQIYVAGI